MKKVVGILQVILVIIGVTLLEMLLYSPFDYIGESILTLDIMGIGTFYNIMYEISVNIVVIALLIKIFNIGKLGLREKIDNSNNLILFTVLLILGYHNVYSNTIGILVNMIEISPWLTESFEGLIQYPVYALLSLCIFAPIFEEIVYRGIILRVLLKRHSVYFSVFFSSLLFACVHFNIHQGINALVVGILISFIYVKTKSLRLCIFAHFFNNFYVLLEGYFEIGIENFVLGRFIIGIIVMTIGFLGFYFSNINKYLYKKATE